MLNITKKTEGTVLNVILEGDLDRTTAPELESAVINELQGTEELIIDLEKLVYISSAGLRVLVKFHKKMLSQGKMSLINVNKGVKDILDLSGLSGFFTIAANA